MLASVEGSARLEGEVRVPGDKSVSHRSLILNAIAEGQAEVVGLSAAADVASTASCLRALGVEIQPAGSSSGQGESPGARVLGRGLGGLCQSAVPLDCGNSGTTMRLLAGILAAQPFSSTLVGDESLSARPMERLVRPLRLMGARADTDPLRVGGGDRLTAIDYTTPVSSAQLKSALLLAGLYAPGTTRVSEPAPSRDHTERMLVAMGAELEFGAGSASIRGPAERLAPLSLAVPGDLSAAAFWLVAAGLSRRGRVRLPGVGVNPSRTALLEVLSQVGISVRVSGLRHAGQEPVADLEVGGGQAPLRALEVRDGEAARLIDELPVLAVAAAFLPGVSRITGAAELRVKESDRIVAMAEGLERMGGRVKPLPDGWEIHGGGGLEGGKVAARGDHRVAMALAVAALLAQGKTEIEGAECVGVSYPQFWDHLELLCST
jgi:3-phosphoshikimate 1-carboxyvinyltransferase